MYDDDRPVVICGEGWKELSEGSWEFRVSCGNEVEFVTLPDGLNFRQWGIYYVWGWLPEKQIAFYRLGKPTFKPGRWLNETFRTQEEMMASVRYHM
jgi:hypothetical protein